MSNTKLPAAAPLTEISPDALDAVVGGRRTATSSSAGDTRVLDAITGLGASLKTLGTQNQGQSSGGDSTALMMALLGGGLGGRGPTAAPACQCPMNNVIRR